MDLSYLDFVTLRVLELNSDKQVAPNFHFSENDAVTMSVIMSLFGLEPLVFKQNTEMKRVFEIFEIVSLAIFAELEIESVDVVVSDPHFFNLLLINFNFFFPQIYESFCHFRIAMPPLLTPVLYCPWGTLERVGGLEKLEDVSP